LQATALPGLNVLSADWFIQSAIVSAVKTALFTDADGGSRGTSAKYKQGDSQQEKDETSLGPLQFISDVEDILFHVRSP